jgi:RNA polymerase sigma-70 factor (ECF subfamily)
MDEQKLINSAKEGNKKALSELVMRYEKTIYNFAFKISRDPLKAENIMQETFLSMIKYLPQFDGKSKLSTWLYRIVTNHYLMELRKQKNNFVPLDDENDLFLDKYTADWDSVPSKFVENEELKEILDKAIQNLSPEYRIVFLLRDVEGLSTEETGKVVGLTVPAVKSRLHRARAFLRKEINDEFRR